MLLLAHDDVAGLLAPEEIIEAMREVLLEQSKGLVQVPPSTTVDSSSGFGWLRTMPAILNGSKVMGFKAMHSTPGVGVGYYVDLYDLPSGEQARSMLIAASKVRHLGQINVFSPTPKHRQAFADAIGREQGLNIKPVERPEQAVAGCDLLLSVFRAGKEPAVCADWITPGMHICAARSVRPVARGLEDGIWRKAAVVAGDDRAHAFESGDGRSAIASRAFDPERAVELWELVSGKQRGRTADSDITLFKSVGTALQDLAIANAIYLRAKQKGVGRDVGNFPKMRPHA